MIFAGGLAGLTAVAFGIAVQSHWNLTAISPLLGIVFSVGYYRLARTAVWKWMMALVMALASILIAVNPGDMIESLADYSLGSFHLTMAICGAVYLLSGGISLWLYIHNTQAPEKVSR